MYIIKLAFRNIFRNKRRSLLAIFSVIIALLAIVFFQGMMKGMMDSITKNLTKNETGHVKITTKSYDERKRFNPVDENIEDPTSIIDTILCAEELKNEISLITERFQFGVLLNNEGNNKRAIAFAGDIEKEKELLMLQKSIKEGRYLKGERETIISSSMAESLNLSLGDKLKVMTKGSDDSLRLRNFTVVGIFETGMPSIDNTLFQIPLYDAKKLLRTGEDVQQIIIMLKNYEKSEKVAGILEESLAGKNLAIIPWTKAGGFVSSIRTFAIIYDLMYILIALLGTIIISNIMMMVVMERRREIGILRALGFGGSEILSLFLIEGILLGLIGSIIGISLGTGINIFFSIHGLDLWSMGGQAEASMFPVDRIIYNDVSILSTFKIFLIALVVSGLLSLIPARHAQKMKAVEAMKAV